MINHYSCKYLDDIEKWCDCGCKKALFCPFNSMGSMLTVLLFLQSLAIGDALKMHYNILLMRLHLFFAAICKK